MSEDQLTQEQLQAMCDEVMAGCPEPLKPTVRRSAVGDGFECCIRFDYAAIVEAGADGSIVAKREEFMSSVAVMGDWLRKYGEQLNAVAKAARGR